LGQKRVTQRAQKQNSYRPNENATRRAQLNGAHASAAKDADGRKSGGDGVPTKAKTHKNGSNPRREGGNNAPQLFAETAGSPEGP
jgi:hypothetical protein